MKTKLMKVTEKNMKNLAQNQRYLGFAVIGLALSSILACAGSNRPIPGGSSSNATFVVPTFQAEAVDSVQSDENWKIPTVKRIAFVACMKDRGYLIPANGHSFVVEGSPNIEQESTTANSSGCVKWNETFAYSYYSDQVNLIQERTIRATGVHGGTQTLSFSVNPWEEETSKAVRDLRTEYGLAPPPKLLRPEFAKSAFRGELHSILPEQFKSSSGAELFVGDLELALNQAQVGETAAFNLGLKFSPQAFVLNAEGLKKSLKVAGGTFNVRLTFLEADRTSKPEDYQNIRLLADYQATGENLHETQVTHESKNQGEYVTFKRLVDPYSVKLVVLQVDPVGEAARGLRSFSGYIALDNLPIGTSTGAPVKALPASLQGIVDGSAGFMTIARAQEVSRASLQADDDKCTYGFEQLGYYFTISQVSRGQITKRDKNTMAATEFRSDFEIVVKDTLTKEAVNNHPFIVRVVDSPLGIDSQQGQARSTEPGGVIKWSEDIKVPAPFWNKGWVPKYIEVVTPEKASKNLAYRQLSRAMKIYLNPLQEDSGFFRDCRSGKPQEVKPFQSKIGVEEFHTDGLGMSKKSLDVKMNLVLARSFNLTFKPYVIAWDAMQMTQTIRNPLPGTKFRLSWEFWVPKKGAVKTLSPTPDEIAKKYLLVDGAKNIVVEVNSYGKIETELELDYAFMVLPAAMQRGLIVFQVSPISGDYGAPEPAYALGPFNPTDKAVSAALAKVGFQVGADKMPDPLQFGMVENFGVSQVVSQLEANRAKGTDKLPAAKWEDPFQGAKKLGTAEITKFVFGVPEGKDFFSRKVKTVTVTPGMVEDFIDGKDYVNIPKGFCKLVSNPVEVYGELPADREFDECLKNPFKYFGFNVVREIHRLLGEAEELELGLQLNGLSAYLGQDAASVTEKAGAISAGWHVPLISAVGIDIRGGGEAQTGSVSGTSSHIINYGDMSLVGREFRFKFPANVTKCLLIRKRDPKSKTHYDPNKRWYYCLEGTRNEVLTESYYHMEQVFGAFANTASDTERREHRPWTKVLRGKSALIGFFELFDKKTRDFEIDSDQHFSSIRATFDGTYISYLASGNGPGTPGFVSRPILPDEPVTEQPLGNVQPADKKPAAPPAVTQPPKTIEVKAPPAGKKSTAPATDFCASNKKGAKDPKTNKVCK
jgi:hypothetical protein